MADDADGHMISIVDFVNLRTLEEAASRPPWVTGRTRDPMIGNDYFDRHCQDGSAPIEGHGGPGALGTAIGVTFRPEDAQLIATARNALTGVFDELDRLRAKNVRLREALQDILDAQARTVEDERDEYTIEVASLALGAKP